MRDRQTDRWTNGQTDARDAQSSKGNSSKSIKDRVAILVLCMSSHAD